MSTESSPADTERAGAGPDPRRWLALAVICVSMLMVVLDVSIVNIALPRAQIDLGISDADRQWVVTAYALAFGGLLLLGGRVVDFAGRKRVFVIGLLGFAAASMLGGLAPSAGLLFAARALQGGFSALLAPASLSLITVSFTEPRERAKAFGIYGAIQGGGGAVGLILGGVLTEYADWRWCLFVNVPIAIAAASSALPVVRESRADGERHYDVPGALLVTGGLVALVYGFTRAAEGTGWLAPSTLGLLAAAAALLVAFVVVEKRATHPLLPLRVVLDRNRGGSFLASVLIGAGMFGMLLFLTFYFQVNLGYTPIQAGLAYLPFSAGVIAASTLGSGLVTRLGARALMSGGIAVAAVGMFWLTGIDASSSYVSGALPAEIVTSLGLGLFFLAVPNVALAGVAPHDIGVTSAMLSTSQQIGGALGPALLNTLYVSALAAYFAPDDPASGGVPRTRLLEGYLYGYRVAYLAGGVLFVLALAAVVSMLRTSKARTRSDETSPAHTH
ncbi:MFS transporter [Planotetraspora phitsanulokensis]|uniref:MFS transporter n=1 Tax=Planotetraspora phitsanulokensis TaxID=575192 RepID=A0A8J3U1A8_9ACTN|nr:MFS transporter [Planotetraspora phitsanulokensis]GII36718.1 MFS transporter [Planotetraspora phitsanulokensis]